MTINWDDTQLWSAMQRNFMARRGAPMCTNPSGAPGSPRRWEAIMKLDDRPVIDQLLNPTPLNHLEEVRDEMVKFLDGEEADTGKAVLAILRDAIKELDLDLSADTLDRLDKTLEYAADDVAEWITDSASEAVGETLERLEARL